MKFEPVLIIIIKSLDQQIILISSISSQNFSSRLSS